MTLTQPRKFFWFSILITSLSASLLCQGQESPTEESRSNGRPVKILYYQAPANAPSEAYIYAGEQQVARTELTRTSFSETFHIPQGKLRLSFLPKPLVDGEVPDSRPPVVNIPESWEKVLLLVIEHKQNRLMPIRVKAINASDNAFGPGSIYMLNYSDLAIYGTMGTKKLQLKPQSIQIFKKPIEKNGYYPVKLQSLVKGETQPRRFIRQMWSNSDQVRNVLFIIPKPAPMHATYYCAPIRDF